MIKLFVASFSVSAYHMLPFPLKHTAQSTVHKTPYPSFGVRDQASKQATAL